MSVKKLRRGFTLTEFLIVIGLVVVLSAIGLVNLYGKNKSERFNSALVKLVATINEGANNSKTLKGILIDTSYSSYKFAAWKVYFVAKGCKTPYSYCRLTGPGYCLVLYDGLNSYNYGTYVLPDGVNYDPVNTPGLRLDCGSPKQILFQKNSGAPIDVSTAKVGILLTDNPSISSTISVSALGKVEFTSNNESLNR